MEIEGLSEAFANINKVEKQLIKRLKKPIRQALNAGAKDLKSSMKPLIPTLKSSTNFRQKGTIKNNLRHKTKIAKDGRSGVTTIRISRAKGSRMARLGENTRDRRDPFYWWMVEYGTKKMPGQHFMEKSGNKGASRALKVVKKTFLDAFKKEILK